MVCSPSVSIARLVLASLTCGIEGNVNWVVSTTSAMEGFYQLALLLERLTQFYVIGCRNSFEELV